MEKALAGKVAVVTGAGLGIGKGIAQRFVEEGATVVVAELNEEAGQTVAEELGQNALFLPADASDKASVESMVQSTLDALGFSPSPSFSARYWSPDSVFS